MSGKEAPTVQLGPKLRLQEAWISCCALKWEVALHIWSDQIVWANGPFKASCHDITVLRSGLKAKMLADAPDKYVFAIMVIDSKVLTKKIYWLYPTPTILCL